MDRTMKMLICMCVALGTGLMVAMYVLVEVSHTIDTLYVDLRGVSHGTKTEVEIKHDSMHGTRFNTTYVRDVYADAVIILENVPQGNYTVRIPTEKCKPRPPTIAEYPGHRAGSFFASFGVSDNRRWITLPNVVFIVDLDACKTHLESTRSKGWTWRFR